MKWNAFWEMMTIKDLRELLIHFQDKEYDDYKVILWDYNHQQELNWGGMHSLSHPDKTLVLPVEVPPVDGINVVERLRLILKDEQQKD